MRNITKRINAFENNGYRKYYEYHGLNTEQINP